MNTKFSDFIFEFASGNTLKAHRLKLYEDSQYFKDLFDNSQQQTLKKISFDLDSSIPISKYSIMLDYINILYNNNSEDKIDIKKIFLLNEYIDSKCLHKYIESVLSNKLDTKINTISIIKLINYMCINNERYIKYIKSINKLSNTLSIESIIVNYSHFTNKAFKIVLKNSMYLSKCMENTTIQNIFKEHIENIYKNDVIKFNMISLNYISLQLKRYSNFISIDYYICDKFDFDKIKKYYQYFTQLEKINDFISKNKSNSVNKYLDDEEEEEEEEDY